MWWTTNSHSNATSAAVAQDPLLTQSVSASGSATLSIPASAFTPKVHTYEYENHGRYLFHHSAGSLSIHGYYLAPVNLPHGATVTRITFHFKDLSAEVAKLSMYRQQIGTQYLAGIMNAPPLQSTDIWPPGFGSSFIDTTGPSWLIDNQHYGYYLYLDLPPSPSQTVGACGVEITYTPPQQTTNPGYLNVMPAAAIPFEPGYSFTNAGFYLLHEQGPANSSANGWYLAPVHLPQGATVTRMTFYWEAKDYSLTGLAKLQRSRLGQDTYEDMASASSNPATGTVVGTSPDNTITGAVIDNSRYSYWVILDLPAAPWPGYYLEGRAVSIEFTYPTTRLQHIAVPAAGFRPFEDGYTYQDHGRHLIHTASLVGNVAYPHGWYLAPLNLPDGVEISKMTFYWYKNSSQPGTAKLQRTKLGQGNYEDLAVASTGTGGPTTGSSSTTTIAGGKVDNSQYAYWLIWDLPPTSPGVAVQGHGVVLEIGRSLYLPLLFK